MDECKCKHNDCGWCYHPDLIHNGCVGYVNCPMCKESIMKTKEERLLAIEEEAKKLREEIEAEAKPHWQVGDCFSGPFGLWMIFSISDGFVACSPCGRHGLFGTLKTIDEVNERIKGHGSCIRRISPQEWLDARK